jgi:hypothetical protein
VVREAHAGGHSEAYGRREIAALRGWAAIAVPRTSR